MKLRDALRIPAADITDETVYRDRRRLLAAFATAPALAVAGCGRAGAATAAAGDDHARAGEVRVPHRRGTDHLRGCHQLQQLLRIRHRQGRPFARGQTLRTSPWTVAVGGKCEARKTLARRPAQGPEARGTHLPHALRRRLVDGDPVAGRAAGGRAQALRADRAGEVRRLHQPRRPAADAGVRASVLAGPTARGCASTRRCIR